jgi:2-polyprenyl-6-methoxyphenol hydroxylase-like FAD-dependent oxidoreductase
MATILISGSGIAGPTLAYWLVRHGNDVTVVERSGALRSSGSPIDVRGPAVEVAERMGVFDQIKAAGTKVTDLVMVNERGRRVGRVNTFAMRRSDDARDVELPRGDLADILFTSVRHDAEFIFNDAIVGLRQHADGVDVTFDRAEPRTYDLVIGADGLHSAVRRLAFGPESRHVRHTGVYVATMPLHEPLDNDHDVVMFNTPGRCVTLHPGRGKALVAFMYRAPAVPDFNYRDTAQHKRMLTEAFKDEDWRVPDLLDKLPDEDELYFDSVSQVVLPTWSTGRVAVLGDAASCVSLFGDGSTLAMAGAYTLAMALHDGGDAFAAYEAKHRQLVEPKQRNVGRAADLLIPASRVGIASRNAAARLWPIAAAASRLRARLKQ